MCPVKYHRDVFTETVPQTLKTVCLEFGPAYDIYFLEIGIDEDRVHFLIQTIPNIRFSDLVKKIKKYHRPGYLCQTSRGENKTLGRSLLDTGLLCQYRGKATMSLITNYVKNQGIPQYQQLHAAPPQASLFTT